MAKKSHLKLRENEIKRILEYKQLHPYLSHRKISGYLRYEGLWISPTSCYNYLKLNGLITPYEFREAPWKKPRYNVFRKNVMWGVDWSIIRVFNERWFILLLIDFFSRYIIAWGIMNSVTQKEIQDLILLGYQSQCIGENDPKPMIRADRGSPNVATTTKKYVKKDLGGNITYTRAYRPTDNAYTERAFRTVKQEIVYVFPEFPTVEMSRTIIGKYIEEYNTIRPHQSLFNFTPDYVHQVNNMSRIYEEYKGMMRSKRKERIKMNLKEV
jgi:putative transposase